MLPRSLGERRCASRLGSDRSWTLAVQHVRAMMPSVRIRDAELAVDRRGDGPLVLWGHGLMQSRANEDTRRLWTIADDVRGAGFEFVRYDARGHGESSGAPDPSVYQWSSLAEDALALHQELTGAPAVLGGASMGAATMLHAAVRNPQSARALVLVIPPTAWETRAGQRQVYENSASFVRAKGKARYVEAVQKLPVIPILADHPALHPLPPDITEEFLPFVLEGAAASDLPPIEALRTLDVPTLILAWDTDPVHPVSTASTLHDTLPRSTLHIAQSVADTRAWGERTVEFLRSL